MSNLEKLFCRCRALGLTDEDELFECLSAAVSTDGHVCVGGKNLLEQTEQRPQGEAKTQSAAEIRHMEHEWMDEWMKERWTRG